MILPTVLTLRSGAPSLCEPIFRCVRDANSKPSERLNLKSPVILRGDEPPNTHRIPARYAAINLVDACHAGMVAVRTEFDLTATAIGLVGGCWWCQGQPAGASAESAAGGVVAGSAWVSQATALPIGFRRSTASELKGPLLEVDFTIYAGNPKLLLVADPPAVSDPVRMITAADRLMRVYVIRDAFLEFPTVDPTAVTATSTRFPGLVGASCCTSQNSCPVRGRDVAGG